MDKRYFEEFMGIFGHIKYAASLIPEDFYTPGVNRGTIRGTDEIEHLLDQRDKWDNAFFINVLDEVEQNLYMPPESREIYLTNILRSFIGIAPYLNFGVVKEYCPHEGRDGVKINNITYPYSLAILHKTLIKHEAWRNHDLDNWDGATLTIPVKYAIQCFRIFLAFFKHLDKLSDTFNLDLGGIQKKHHMHIFAWFATSEQKGLPIPDFSEKLISFDSPETIASFLDELKGYFPGKGTELKKALDGEKLNELLVFPGNSSTFVEVFRRAKYNGKIVEHYTQIGKWICLNFAFRFKKGKVEKTERFKESTVYDTLIGKEGTQPTKAQRILQGLDWLPYKTKNQLKMEKQKEKLQ